MTAPGVIVRDVEPVPARRAPTDTDPWFVAAPAQRGPLGVLELGPTDVARLGAYIPEAQTRECAEAFFALGGEHLLFSRVVGPGARAATAALGGLNVAAREVGEYGNTLTVQPVAGQPDGIVLVVADAVGEVERSPALASKAGAVAWSQTRATAITITDSGAGALPAAGPAVALAGGTSDLANVTDAQRADALTRFTRDLGPGQVSLPGVTTQSAHTLLAGHAAQTNRVAVCDLPDVHDVGALSALGLAHRGQDAATRDGARRAGAFASWWTAPGASPIDSPRHLPPSALVAGLCASNDLAGLPASQAPAGAWGQADTALGLTQAAYTDEQRDLLNEASVNVSRVIYGGVRLYGFRSLADPRTDPQWAMLTAARTVMLVRALVAEIGESVEFATIDAQGVAAATFGSRITDALKDLWKQGALYGASEDEAFTVDIGVTVNDLSTARERRLQAALALTVAPTGEQVRITITNDPVGG